MIPGIVAGGNYGSAPPSVVSYIGGDYIVNGVGNPTLNVPGLAMAGDTVFVVLRCREDRSMSGFSGWTTHLSTAVYSGGSGDFFTRAYVLSRTLAAETSFSFTQSSASAYGAALMAFRGGSFVGGTYADGNTVSRTKTNPGGVMLAMAFNSNDGVLPTTNLPCFTGYTARGQTYYDVGSYYYTAYAETKDGDPAGSVSATANIPATTTGQSGVYLLEIA